MDTILSPRQLSQTDDSSDESERTITSQGFSSTLNTSQNLPFENPQSVRKKVIICPTAKYLEVNRKKISSFDLLVHPPKRPRLAVPSITSSDNLSTSIGKTILESVHYENETGDMPSSITTCSSNKGTIDSASEQERDRNFSKFRQSINSSFLPSKDDPIWNRLALLYRQSGRDTNTPISEEPVVMQRLERGEELRIDEDSLGKPGDDTDNEKWAEFPFTKSYIYYLNYSPQFSSIFGSEQFTPIFKTVNEKEDVNQNFLANKSKSEDVNDGLYPYLISSAKPHDQLRRYKKPVYRLKGIANCDQNDDMSAPDESSYPSIRLPPIFDSKPVTSPPFKRRKLNAPGEVPDQDEELSMKEAYFIFRICNELTHESQTIAGPVTPLNDTTIPVYANVGSDESDSDSGKELENHSYPYLQVHETFPNFVGPTHQSSSEMEFFDCDDHETTLHRLNRFTPISMLQNMFHHPRVHSEPIGIGMLNNDPQPFYVGESGLGGLSDNNNIHNCSIPITETVESPLISQSQFTPRCSPITIIVESPIDIDMDQHPNSGFLFPFMDLIRESRSRVTIEDVTDTCIDEEEYGNIEMILPINEGDLSREESTSPSLLDLSPSEFEDEANIDQPYDVDDTRTQEEVILQPNPQLTFSSSVHSLPMKDRKHATLDQFLEKRRKSDYFVGKLTGLSKSIMKLYQKYGKKSSKHATNVIKSEEVVVVNPTCEEAQDSVVEVCNRISQANKSFDVSQSESRVNSVIEVLPTVDIEEGDTDVVHLSPSHIKSSTSSIKTLLKSCRRRISSRDNRISITSTELTGTDTNVVQISGRESIQAEAALSQQILPEATSGSSTTHDKLSCCCGTTTLLFSLPKPSGTNVAHEFPNLLSHTKQPVEVVQDKNGNLAKLLPSLGVFKRLMKFISSAKKKLKRVRIKAIESVSSGDITGQEEDDEDEDETCSESIDININQRPKRQEEVAPVVTKKRSSGIPRTIAGHTDSREFYRERRRKFFNELREFQEDSLKVYHESTTTGKKFPNLSFSNTNTSKLNTKPPLPLGKADQRPISQTVNDPRKRSQDKGVRIKNDSNNNDLASPLSFANMPERKAISTSALSLGETRLRSFLLPSRQIPLVAGMLMTRSNGIKDQSSSVAKSCKPRKGILKNVTKRK